MWDPVRLSHFCDRCDEQVNITMDDFRLSLFATGGKNVPTVIPDELRQVIRGFGFKAPLFCHKCTLPMMKLVMEECKNFKEKRTNEKEESDNEGGPPF